jgi:hypothetical protein
MKYVGIDLHKKSISVCVRDASDQVVTRRRCSWSATCVKKVWRPPAGARWR